MPERGRVAILISGRGSNMVSLLEAMRAGRIEADPVLVLSNVAGAAGIERAKEFGVDTEVIESRKIKPRAKHEEQVVAALKKKRVDLVCLAGYMRLLSPLTVQAFPQRIFNIHPSLLPSFPGLNAQQQALDRGVKVAGCTVHVVDEHCDHGPIILQAPVPVLEDDTAETLSARTLELEHRIYPQAVALFFAGRLRIEADRVQIVG